MERFIKIQSDYTEKKKRIAELFDWDYSVISIDKLTIDETETDFELMKKVSTIEMQKLIKIETDLSLN